jgi:CspA family cold shock protein
MSHVRDFACLATSPFEGTPKTTLKFGLLAVRWSCRLQTPMSVFQRRPNMATGTVKFFNSQKGFGFIQPSDGAPDVFVHVSAVERAGMSGLVEGQKVSFDVVTERGKKAASNLQAA